jgi:hypothetical protein
MKEFGAMSGVFSLNTISWIWVLIGRRLDGEKDPYIQYTNKRLKYQNM